MTGVTITPSLRVMDTSDLSSADPSKPSPAEAPATDGSALAAQPLGAEAGGGEAAPPLVIRGESNKWIGHDPDTGERAYVIPVGRRGEVKLIPIPQLEAHPYSAITDWLNFTFPMASLQCSLKGFFDLLLETLGPEFGPVTARRFGKHCYERSFELGQSRALFCCGGNSDTGLVSLAGESCAVIKDWQKVIELGQHRLRGKPTRWDGAVDDYLGTHSVDYALQLYLDGKFGTGGNEPTMRQIGNWAKPDGRGRSIEIGNRENGKRLQVYEKGMQLGAKWHPWTRWEVQLGSEGRNIPWDVLLNPGGYVVGQYPKALSWVQEEMSRIATLQKHAKISYEVLTRYARQSYGRHINVMLEVEGSPEKVIQRLQRAGMPARLDHPARPKIEGSND